MNNGSGKLIVRIVVSCLILLAVGYLIHLGVKLLR